MAITQVSYGRSSLEPFFPPRGWVRSAPRNGTSSALNCRNFPPPLPRGLDARKPPATEPSLGGVGRVSDGCLTRWESKRRPYRCQCYRKNGLAGASDPVSLFEISPYQSFCYDQGGTLESTQQTPSRLYMAAKDELSGGQGSAVSLQTRIARPSTLSIRSQH